MTENGKYIDSPADIPEGFGWVKWTPMFRYAWDMATKGNFEITTILGQGGCGKSVLLEMLYRLDPVHTLVLAPTGIAAFRIIEDGVPASTIHSAFRFRPHIWQDPLRVKTKAVTLLQNVRRVLIDEVSMVDANMLDAIIVQILAAQKKYNHNIDLVLFGDIYQLPPVAAGARDETTRDMWHERYGDGTMFFYSEKFQEANRINIELEDVHRQDSEIFRGILERIRIGEATKDDLRLLNRHVFTESSYRDTIGKNGMMYLAGTNRQVDTLNEAYTSSFAFDGLKEHKFTAEIAGDATLQDFRMPKATISLYKGMHVMCLANEKYDNGNMIYQNGTLGKICGFNDAGLPLVRTPDGRSFEVHWHTFIKYVPETDEKGNIEMVESGSIHQIGCRPAYAVTFHKSQGLTLDAVYIDISQWSAPGSVYLGLSRLRSETGLGLKRALRLKDIRLSPETVDFYQLEEISYP